MRLTEAQRTRQEEFSTFARLEVAPFAADWDRDQRIPGSVVQKLARSGYLGCSIPGEFGGQGWDLVTFGLLNETLGRFCSALTDVLTVQTMVSSTLLKWGSAEQRRTWLRPLAEGRITASFALTEPAAGSAVQAIATALAPSGDGFVLNGTKKWISWAQFADVMLVFGKLGERSVACIVPRESAGLSIEPIRDLMGFRAAGLAELHFDNVWIPAANLVGKPGFALSHVAQHGLHFARLSAACSALGLLRGCFEESTAYAAERRIDGTPAGDLGMIRTLIARMGTDLSAARALCYDACQAAQERLPEAIESVLVAKYFASRAAVRAASDAVQIHGAAGCHGSAAVSRYYRDAKVLEIIEGTTQVHEEILGKIFVDRAATCSRATQPDAEHERSTNASPRAGRFSDDRPVQPHASAVSG